VTNIYDLDTPTLLVDLDRLESNIQDMADAARMGGKRLRPHTKTHKTPEIAQMQRMAGAIGITVAKVGEAEVMAQAGFEDIFIANEIVGPLKVARLMALRERVRIIVGVDSFEAAKPLSDAAALAGTRLPVRIEVDTGHGRAGIAALDEVCELARQITDLPGLELQGVFTHEGHSYTADNESGRRKAVQDAAARIREIAAALAVQGTPIHDISMGSTPSAKFLPEEAGVTEMRPGSYVFNDRMQVRYGASKDRCVVSVLATVTSVRPGGRIILDAGTKSLASDRPFADGTFGEIIGHPELTFTGASEEHGTLRVEGVCGLRVGDKVRILPNHVCTCVNMHDTLTAFRGETIEAVWNIAARGKVR
jgi:D-serine deaminase-like pyridoxal phosphate-dependent protein